MMDNDACIDRKSSKEKVDRIHRLRVEIEKIREENSYFLNKLDKYDNWLIESIDKINDLLDENISDDIYDYEEESIEYDYDYDSKDLDFGEKKKSKFQTHKKINKITKISVENEGSEIKNDAEKNEQSSQLKHKIEITKKEKTKTTQSSSWNQTSASTKKTDDEKKAKTNIPTPPVNSSPLEILFKLKPQLAIQILRPFIDEYKKKLLQDSNNKMENAQINLPKKQEPENKDQVEEPIKKTGILETNNADNKNDDNSQGNKSKEEEPFDDL